jgi:FMN phosphatase YigB (HAD superfamily)
MIEAVTFDLWDTLVIDDSDEEARSAMGLPSKPEARKEAVVSALRAAMPDLATYEILDAWGAANAAFHHCWKVEMHTPSVAWRVDKTLGALGLSRYPAFDQLVDKLQTMERDIPPAPLPGALDCLAALKGRYRLGIISDAIITPGHYLRDILAGHGLLDCFDHVVFSDEAGRSKPHAKVFQLACEGLGCKPEELVHVGDREPKDVAGANAFGARAILFTGAVDRGKTKSKAVAVCPHLAALPGILEELDNR